MATLSRVWAALLAWLDWLARLFSLPASRLPARPRVRKPRARQRATTRSTAPDAKADGTLREQYEERRGGEEPSGVRKSHDAAPLRPNQGTAQDPTSQPAPGAVLIDPRVLIAIVVAVSTFVAVVILFGWLELFWRALR